MRSPENSLFKDGLKRSLVLAMVGFLSVLSAAPAHAQSNTCRNLQNQLASLGTSRGDDSSKFRQYQAAVREQDSQIRKTERAAQKNDCEFIDSNKCARINSSLDRMYENLRKLERVRDQLSGSGQDNSRARNRLQLALQQNRCGEKQEPAIKEVKVDPNDDRRKTLIEQIFGNKTYNANGATVDEGAVDPGLANKFGTYRTLCVRTCDGYYFPMSFSTRKEQFASDQEQCSQICPGTEVTLFYHPAAGGDAETSISYRNGEAYSKLENAFSYRKAVNTECSCKSAKLGGLSEIAGAEAKPEEPAVAANAPKLPLANLRVDPALDLETVENLSGKMTLDKLASLANGGPDTNDVASGEKANIRIVGPAFFPVQ